MPIFHCKQSLIDRIKVTQPHHGILHACIVASENADMAAFEKLREQLSAKKFSTLMDTENGRPAIEVRGLRDAKSLLAALGELGLIGAQVQTEKIAGDDKTVGFREKVRGKALFLSALFYDLGNAAFLVSGFQRGRHNKGGKFMSNDISEMMIGGAFSVGDIVMTAYGGVRGDEELSAAERGLKRHLHKKGIEIPKGDELNPDTLYQSGALKATDRWLRQHVTQIKCLSETAGGLFTIHSGLKPGNVNRSKVAAGLLVTTGWFGTFLLDKPRGHQIFNGDKPPPSSAAELLADNPRGLIARPVAIGNNLANLWGALGTGGERSRFHNDVAEAQRQLQTSHTADNMAHLAYTKARQHDYRANVVSASSFLVANFLFGVSGGKRPADSEDDKSMMNDLVLLSANVLAKQPEPVRQLILSETAEYVSKLSHVSLGKKEVEKAISEKIDNLHHSRWATRIQTEPVSTQQERV